MTKSEFENLVEYLGVILAATELLETTQTIDKSVYLTMIKRNANWALDLIRAADDERWLGNYAKPMEQQQ